MITNWRLLKAIIPCILLVLFVASSHAQEHLPVIDMHLHALAADDQGPPPLAICTPIDPFPAWDPAQPYGATFMTMLKEPRCDNPVWSPMTEEGADDADA